ncbi:U2 small nuclear ribonucleoprotein auxiliary factor protein [Heracleum sosnowskyi]|uniref:U2 small nuclear ribonucleoprotein auxiliary factor protein n=1 Tax=Heracleum sosnowskyi TaxID=360622 RepID=A0AAD8H8J9_9APIA|nr:U2 small nuclear ribonucleoprotein auxiliary factor protein [Heracleum sosnowskyi]
MGKLDDFEPIIGEPKTEGLVSTSKPLLPHILYVDAPESSKLRIVVTDFKFSTWMAVKSVIQLQNMRDNIGIGGPWSEFIEYVITSINSRDAKIVFEGQSIADGPAYAKLVAQKSEGMPLVCVHLNKLVGGAAVEAIGNVSQELFKAYKSQHELLVKEQEGRYQLTEMVAAEQAKSEILERDLNLILSSKRHKSQHLNERSTSDSLKVSTLQQTQAVGKEADVFKESTKVIKRVVPAYRRAKVREVLLHDKDDDDADI